MFALVAGLEAGAVSTEALATESGADIRPVLSEYCFECHGNDSAEGRINLEEMTGTSDFGRRFQDWEKVTRVLRERKMPPKKMPQPSDSKRKAVIQTVSNELSRFIEQHAGDPGRVIVRRLTSAEYAYTIHDLTGLEFKKLDGIVSDAASGEGFTNAGAGQFMQDSTLERYLEMAKIVADHAVIGAGPLEFYRRPGSDRARVVRNLAHSVDLP